MISTSVSRKKAKAILETLGLADQFDPDYFIESDRGEEWLSSWGNDQIIFNRGTTFWLSPGHPKGTSCEG